ncbi:MAG: GMC oxidoreductase [Pseudohongiellaceae bacterium]
MSEETQFDAIVIGSGITGGWAAKELTEKGLKVLMLERGRMVEHGRDYTGEHKASWQLPYQGRPLRELYERDYIVQSKNYAFEEGTRHFYNNDRLNPYIHDPTQFNWLRTDVVGGKSLLWARQTYRWSDLDFEANIKDGHGIDWPIRYRDISPWYDHVESFIGVSGQAENLPQLPDGQFLPPMKLNIVERHLREQIADNFPGRVLTIGRTATLTVPHNGRGACHYCGPCQRGCSVGASFSTQSSTLPAARSTGNLTLIADSVVEGIDYDPATERASGVRVIDTNTLETTRYTGKLIFVCAGTIASTQILLNSRSETFPDGLANSSGVLGHYLMDHTLAAGATGIFENFEDKVEFGRRPNGIYMPRFRNLDGQDDDIEFIRGYGYQGEARRMGWAEVSARTPGFGADFKQALRKPGPWIMNLIGFGECLPYRDNYMELDARETDRFGIPLVRFHFTFRENENNMREDMMAQAQAMLQRSGAVSTSTYNNNSVGGDGIHEMGSARMGNNPQESVLNSWCQSHDVPNLFIPDGSCMTSTSCVNPSLTYMALTARAVDNAVTQLRAGNI